MKKVNILKLMNKYESNKKFKAEYYFLECIHK